MASSIGHGERKTIEINALTKQQIRNAKWKMLLCFDGTSLIYQALCEEFILLKYMFQSFLDKLYEILK